MTHSWTRLLRALAIGAVALSTACVSVTPPRFLQVSSDRDWTATFARANALAAQGHIAQADSLLAHYATTYPSAPQSVEADYWRALFTLKSPAATQSISQAIPLLQRYVAAGPSTQHWIEADALLRVASRVDTLTRVAAIYISRGEVSTDAAAASAAAAAKVDANAKADAKAASADTKALEEEIRKLRDELAKSKEELERIKKRLAEPPKKPPR